jgi:LPS sulfotransferase NodH
MTVRQQIASRLPERLRQLLARRRIASHAYPEQFAEAADLAEYTGPPRLYLVATTPRCGSHFFGHAVAECRHFGFPLEYLNSGNMAVWHARFGTSDTASLLAQLVRHRSGPTGWFGIKAHWSQFARFEGDAALQALGGFERAIWVLRRDLPGQAISYERAAQTGQWISSAPQKAQARYNYAAIVKRARDVRAQNDAWRARFADRFGQPVLRIVYEDMMADPARIFGEFTDFLDPKAQARPVASPRTQRQSGTPGDDWRPRYLADLRQEDRCIMDAQYG